MQITLDWLKENCACQDAIDEWKHRNLSSINAIDCAHRLIKEELYDWANWFIAHALVSLGKYNTFALHVANSGWCKASKEERKRIHINILKYGLTLLARGG